MHNIGLAIAAAVGTVAVFTALSYVMADAKRSRAAFIIIGFIIACVLFLMIGVEREIRTDHLSKYGLFTDRPYTKEH